MSCPVYCLVPDPDQLDPLVDRLQEAGISMRDILVIERDRERERPPGAGPAAGPPLLHVFWRFQLAPAVWWWPLAVGEFVAASGPRAQGGEKRANEIISLAAYKRRRRAGAE